MRDRIVCNCFRKTLGEIIDTVNEKDCISAEQVGDEINAGTRCGSCIPMIERVIEIENIKKLNDNE
jgi:NAD(P)H-nitrite reductase large subunit